LSPSLEADSKEITRFEEFLVELEAIPENELGDGDARLKKWVTEMICRMKEKNSAR
jgi:hypothetical protein